LFGNWPSCAAVDLVSHRPSPLQGKRIVVIPAVIEPAVRQRISALAEPDGNRLVFTSPGGTPLRHTNFRIRVWLPALRAAGLPVIHFHDLRHTGNMLAADAGAGLRELMDQMATPRPGLL